MEKTLQECGCNEEREGETLKDRCDRADAVCGQACDECGLKVASWSDFSAHQEFIEGRIDEQELSKRAASEVGQHAQTFGKYLVIDKEEPKSLGVEAGKKERAKQANKIYRKVCDEAGMTLCFFSDFSSWSEYVKGGLSDAELYDRARDEAEKISQAN